MGAVTLPLDTPRRRSQTLSTPLTSSNPGGLPLPPPHEKQIKRLTPKSFGKNPSYCDTQTNKTSKTNFITFKRPICLYF